MLRKLSKNLRYDLDFDIEGPIQRWIPHQAPRQTFSAQTRSTGSCVTTKSNWASSRHPAQGQDLHVASNPTIDIGGR